MKIHVLIVDKTTGISQTGGIDEPVVKNKEVENALAHFGVQYGTIIWDYQSNIWGRGVIEGTSKVVHYECI